MVEKISFRNSENYHLERLLLAMSVTFLAKQADYFIIWMKFIEKNYHLCLFLKRDMEIINKNSTMKLQKNVVAYLVYSTWEVDDGLCGMQNLMDPIAAIYAQTL